MATLSEEQMRALYHAFLRNPSNTLFLRDVEGIGTLPGQGDKSRLHGLRIHTENLRYPKLITCAGLFREVGKDVRGELEVQTVDHLRELLGTEKSRKYVESGVKLEVTTACGRLEEQVDWTVRQILRRGVKSFALVMTDWSMDLAYALLVAALLREEYLIPVVPIVVPVSTKSSLTTGEMTWDEAARFARQWESYPSLRSEIFPHVEWMLFKSRLFNPPRY